MSSMAAEEAPMSAVGADSAGAALRKAREARGLHIAALAVMLKVPQAKLEALEADRFDELPDATFARALAKSVCRALKADPAPILALLPRGNEPELDRVSRGLNEPFRERSGRPELLPGELLKSPVLIAAAGIAVAALAVFLLPSHWLESLTAPRSEVVPVSPAASEPVPDGSELKPEALLTPASAVIPALVGQAASAAMPAQPAASAAASAPAPVIATAGTGAATPASVPASQLPPPAGAVPLRLKISAESWIEVVDARGQTLLSRLMRPGEQTELNGVPPLKLRVGNVAGTELVFRGQPVDLGSRARDNVARIELN